jgi:alpha-glucosidase (family GH31 glycosyl hydrolase)
MYEANEYQHTCYDPLFFHFPKDENTFTDIEQSILVANVLKVSPIMKAGVTDTFKSYFPHGKWVSLLDFTEVIEGGQQVDLKVRPTVNVHLMPGKMTSFQPNNDMSVKSTSQLLEKPIQLIANRDEGGRAVGSVFLDKGISNDELNQEHFEYYELVLQSKTLHKYLKNGKHAS